MFDRSEKAEAGQSEIMEAIRTHCRGSLEVLMLAWMNRQALEETTDTGSRVTGPDQGSHYGVKVSHPDAGRRSRIFVLTVTHYAVG